MTFDGGRSETEDLVVGADVVLRRPRDVVRSHAPIPRYTGQGVWRVRRVGMDEDVGP